MACFLEMLLLLVCFGSGWLTVAVVWRLLTDDDEPE